jgi:hypothetical protein
LQNITRNSQSSIYLNIYSNGVLTPADSGIVRATVYDADSNAVALTGYSNISATAGDTAGEYSIFLNQNITNTNRVLEVVWSYTLNGVTGTQTDYYKVETTYADINEIIDFLGLGSTPSDMNYYDPNEIQSAEKLARTIIDGYTMQTFGRYYGSQEQVGIGSDSVELIEKMITLKKVYENGLLVVDNTVTPALNSFGFEVEISPTGKAIRIVNPGWDVRYDNQVDPTIMYYGKFRDQSRYKFEGDIGYKYVPEDIKIAAMLLVNDIISNDFNWRNKYLKRVDLSEISFEMAGGAFNGTGNIAVDNILDTYRNLNIVVI